MPDCVNDIYMYKDAQEDFLIFQPPCGLMTSCGILIEIRDTYRCRFVLWPGHWK